MQKIRVLAFGHGGMATGFSRVLENIFRRLHHRLEVVHFAISYKGAGLDRGWKMLPNLRLGDIMGLDQLPGLLRDIRPDLLFYCHDFWLYENHRRVLDHWPVRIPRVVYCPVESQLVHPGRARALADVDALVAYNAFGRAALLNEAALALETDPGFRMPPPEIIFHGTDTAAFHTLSPVHHPTDLPPNRRRARQELFPDRPELWDAFIVLNANRNQLRKRLDLSLRAFADFVRDKPAHVYLYLHAATVEGDSGLLIQAEALGIRDRILITGVSEDHPVVDEARLNLIYNACDCGINTAEAEGWGLIAFEHAATGGFQIVPGHSGPGVLWQGKAPQLSVRPGKYVPEIDPDHLSQILDHVWHNPIEREQTAFEQMQFARSALFDWDRIADQWVRLFERTVAAGFASRTSQTPIYH